jgi:HSP20 family protein
MTLLRSWSPNGSLLNVQDEMHRLLHDFALTGGAAQAASGWIPSVDVHEDEKSYTLRFDLPGVNPKDVKIEMADGKLSIRGERKSETDEGANTHRLERVSGTFERAFKLRARVDSEAVKATYKDGVLTIVVPKAAEAVKREITVELG